MSETASYATDTQDGFSVSSNTETEDAIRENLASVPKPKDGEPVPEKDPVSKAAAELGTLGGKATAAKRAEAEEEKPDAKEAKDETKPDGKPLGKPRDDPKARMLEATRKESEAKKQLAAERAERERLARELAQVREEAKRGKSDGEPERAAPANGRPKPENFDTYEEYLDARDGWNRKEWALEQAKTQSVHARQQRLESHVATFAQAVAKAAEGDGSFQERISPEVLELQPTFTIDHRPDASNWIADELVFSPEQAPALMLYFTEHPDDLQRIAALSSPRLVTREVAKIATRLEAAPAGASSKTEVSRANPPVRPVTGSPHAADPSEVSEEMSFEEHFKRMNARDRSAQRR